MFIIFKTWYLSPRKYSDE